MCLGAAPEKHVWPPEPGSLQDLVCRVHLEQRGQAVQCHRQLRNHPLSSGLARRQAVISTLQTLYEINPWD